MCCPTARNDLQCRSSSSSLVQARLRRPVLWPQALGQVLHSSYVAFFRLPVLPELLWRNFLNGPL